MTTHRVLAVAAAAAGLLAAFASRPTRRHEDHVTAMQLAEWIRGRKPGLRIIDVRSAEEFAAYHLPGAKRLSIDAAVSMPFRPNETAVLISEDGAGTPAIGYENAYVLSGGMRAWLADVMNPTLPENASPEAAASFKKARELSLYFGGAPRRRSGC